MAEPRIHIGSVTAVNPARRELRVEVATRWVRELDGMDWIRLVLRDGEEMRCRLASTRRGPLGRGNGIAIVPLFAGVTRDNVARMKGASVVVLESEVKAASASPEFAAAELVDLKVYAEDGTFLGRVVEAFETAANSVLEVEKPEGGIMLVPAIDAVIAGVDWDAGRLVVHDLAPYVVDDEDANGPRLV